MNRVIPFVPNSYYLYKSSYGIATNQYDLIFLTQHHVKNQLKKKAGGNPRCFIKIMTINHPYVLTRDSLQVPGNIPR